MNCDAMLVRMLDAEPGELKGEGSSVVARHVRDCAKCGLVAQRMVAGTEELAAFAGLGQGAGGRASVGSGSGLRLLYQELRARPSRRLVFSAGFASLAASIVLGVAIQYGLHANLPFDTAPRHDVPLPRTPAELASERTGAIVARIAAPVDLPASAQAYVARRFEDVQPVVPVAIVAPTATVASNELHSSVPGSFGSDSESVVVRVDPPSGTRAAIMKTSTPGITVVWLY